MEYFSTLKMTNRDPRFYSLMGPFLAKREIVSELGNPVWDDPDKIWFVAVREKRVIGFSALKIRRRKAEFCSAYVLPRERQQGVFSRLLQIQIRYAAAKADTAVAMATKMARHVYLSHGFVLIRETKNYAKLILNLQNSEVRQ